MKSKWPTKKLGEVCQIVTGNTPRTSIQDYYGNEYLWAGPSDLDQGVFVTKTNKKLSKIGVSHGGARIVPKDSVLLSCIGNIGKIGIAIENMTTNQQINTFVPNKEILDSKYLYYSLITKIEDFKNASSQTTLPIINKTKCSNIEILLPSLKIQKEIAAKLDEKFTKLREAKKLREEVLFDTEKILSQTLREIFEEGKKKGWEEKLISDICEHPQYGFTASSTQLVIGPKMLRITDIQNGSVDWDTVPYCKCGDVEKYQLKKDDIVFARTGATVGKSFLIKDNPDNTIFASYLIRLRIKDVVLSEFLYYFFQSLEYWNQITENAVGGAQPNVNGTKLANLKISIPAIVEQRQIVSKLDSLSEKIQQFRELQNSQLEDLKKLEKAYLREAFNGELI